ncbi:MAG: hypothetical protein IJQ65_04640 [Kiritimatiellae bacterium]|nr:hypothetical protein [Kiritimatiellia bacterium]
MKQLTFAFAAAGLFGAVAFAAPNGAEQPSFLRAGDTWVLSGDSITFIDLYRQTVQDAIDHFHPGSGIRLVNVGVWGQLTAEAKGRGVEMKPSVVSIMLGMNNVIHNTYGEGHDFGAAAAKYGEQIRRQVRQYMSQGADVLLFSPTLTDETENSYFAPWRTKAGLVEYGRAIRRICDEEGCRYVPVAEDFEMAKTEMGPNETLIPDGVHPYGAGQYAIARSLVHHLRVSSRLADAGERRGFDATALPAHDFSFRPASRFAAEAGEAPRIAVAAPPGTGRTLVRWSVEGTSLCGEAVLDFAVGAATQMVTLAAPPSGLPSGAGHISRMIMSATPERGRARLAVVDLARVKVVRMKDGACGGEVRTDDPRPEGPLVATWRIEEDGTDLWFTGRTYASSFPERPKGPAETWMNSSGMNGIMMMLDLRPPERFADNRFDHDMHMVCFSVLDKPWCVLPLAWINRSLQSCLYGAAERTADGYTWRIGLRGYVVDFRKFDVRRHDYFGFNMVFDDVDDKGVMGRYPIMPYPDLNTLTPERRLNQTVIVDRVGVVPQAGGETTNIGVTEI